MRARDAAPKMTSRSTVSKGMVNTNSEKAQRTIFGLVLARTRMYITFLGRVEGRVFSTRSLVISFAFSTASGAVFSSSP